MSELQHQILHNPGRVKSLDPGPWTKPFAPGSKSLDPRPWIQGFFFAHEQSNGSQVVHVRLTNWQRRQRQALCTQRHGHVHSTTLHVGASVAEGVCLHKTRGSKAFFFLTFMRSLVIRTGALGWLTASLIQRRWWELAARKLQELTSARCPRRSVAQPSLRPVP